MKRWGRKILASALCLTLAFASPSIALAASSAGSLDELAREVAKHGMNRETSFDIEYTGKESDIDKFFAEKNFEFFYSRMSVQDDPTTSDDADYLVGLFNLGKYGLTRISITLTMMGYSTLRCIILKHWIRPRMSTVRFLRSCRSWV